NDLISFNGAKLEDSYIEIGGVKIISQAKVPTPVSCSDYIGKSGYEAIKSCEYNNNDDYWVGAMVECKNQGGRLPNASELAKIAKAIYNDDSISESEDYNETYTANEWDTSVIAKLGIEDFDAWFRLWGDLEYSSDFAWSRHFDFSNSYWAYYYRDINYIHVVCVAD
ncbi:hypothetical protein IJ579_01350, partial [bacterium]|nr:hypothetical protein [bacterium]